MQHERGASKRERVLERRVAERVDSLRDDNEVDSGGAARVGARAALYAPLLVRDRALGVIAAYDKLAPTPASPTRTCGSRSCSPRARPIAVDLSAASPAKRCDASSRRRSSSGVGSRGSSTTRPARRSRPSCSA